MYDFLTQIAVIMRREANTAGIPFADYADDIAEASGLAGLRRGFLVCVDELAAVAS